LDELAKGLPYDVDYFVFVLFECPVALAVARSIFCAMTVHILCCMHLLYFTCCAGFIQIIGSPLQIGY
jgi:hypothetical protein